MIKIIDNLGYNGNLPNFSRDNMTWEEMQTKTLSNLDKGHLVYCTTEDEHMGTWLFLGAEDKIWVKIIEKNGEIVSSLKTYTLEITDPDVKTISISKETHKCGDYPDITTLYLGEKVYPEVNLEEGIVTVSWGNVGEISEESPLIIKLTGK